MVHYRGFRNTDPPRLVEVWNASFTGRGAVSLRDTSLFEMAVFAKPYFDPAGLIVAEDDNRCVGFVHAGFGPSATGAALDFATGLICAIGVRPEYRRRGIGAELLRRSEAYLKDRGAGAIYAGPHSPVEPFYLGLYGGSQFSGFLMSDALAEPFLLRQGYHVCRRTSVLQARSAPRVHLDARVAAHRQRYEVRLDSPKRFSSWWQTCRLSLLEPSEFTLVDKQSQETVALALVWEMESFSWRWQLPAIGLIDFTVKESLRRHGLGTLLLGLVLRHLQEQFFDVTEVHVDETELASLEFFRRQGFTQVDTGQVYQKG